MPLYHIVILALIQGVTEFLPISSSGHLVLTHYILGNGSDDMCWESNRLMDVAVHVGTLFSVLVYFRKDIFLMLGTLHQPKSDGFKLSLHIILASIPVIIVGFVIQQYQFSFLCLVEVMAWMTIIFGIVLWIADRFQNDKPLEAMGYSQALLIGLSQILALVPGVSRSGITMTSARFLGFSRTEAARFSLLLSIVAISGAGTLGAINLVQEGNLKIGGDVALAVLLSFISSWITIILMMKWLSKATFKPFAIYRIILGITLLGLIYSGIF
ncbi:MAG: undecaprenyl-diphosphate phosphatase [Alphaproteobacteria bacterium]|nr:undecaprenyl-diphosphate phosphatase [Alphaproteobacteria bacterium]